MNITKKAKVLDLLDTVREGMSYIISQNVDIVPQLLADCRQALLVINTQFDVSDHTEADLQRKVNDINKTMLELMEDTQNPDIFLERAKYALEKIMTVWEEVDKNLICKLEILFLPYKYSLWDCMESIWDEARLDSSCNCHVVPIPYYDKNSDGSLGMEHYEGNIFPMKIEDFSTYQLETEQPDIIYFHNPYDDYNFVTTVAPRFYTTELARYTRMLVYIPYYIAGFTKNYRNMSDICNSMGCQMADKIVLQSQATKVGYLANGVNANKIVVLGSPKIDAVIKKTNVQVPYELQDKIADRKVILLNTSITNLLRKEGWLLTIKDIMSFMMHHSKVFLIWRPHPLLESTIGTMRSGEAETYYQILELIDRADNIIKDTNADAYLAIGISNALISDYSSILLQYTFTGKPALALDYSHTCRKAHVFCDYFSNYFLEDGDTVENFVDMLINDTDRRRNERLRYARNSVVNGDGTSGMKIHKYIKNLVLTKSGK